MKKIFLTGLILLFTITAIPVLAAEQNINLQVDIKNNDVISSHDLISNNYFWNIGNTDCTLVCSLNNSYSDSYVALQYKRA